MKGPQINGHGKNPPIGGLSLVNAVSEQMAGPTRCNVNLKTTAKEELLKLAQSIEHDLAAARAEIAFLNRQRREGERQTAALDSANVALRTTVDVLAAQLARASERAARPLI